MPAAFFEIIKCTVNIVDLHNAVEISPKSRYFRGDCKTADGAIIWQNAEWVHVTQIPLNSGIHRSSDPPCSSLKLQNAFSKCYANLY